MCLEKLFVDVFSLSPINQVILVYAWTWLYLNWGPIFETWIVTGDPHHPLIMKTQKAFALKFLDWARMLYFFPLAKSSGVIGFRLNKKWMPRKRNMGMCTHSLETPLYQLCPTFHGMENKGHEFEILLILFDNPRKTRVMPWFEGVLSFHFHTSIRQMSQ